jgi:predicted RNase H-like HicB family nuclease
VTTGKTLDETERNIREAISGHLETLREFGETAPEPTSIAREIEVAPSA